MKKIILLFAGLVLAFASGAQITLVSTAYPTSLIGTDTLKVTTAASAFPSLAVATNGSWDMSTVTDSSAILYAYRVNPDTVACQFSDSNMYSFSTYTYQGNVQSSLLTGGLMEYGVDVQAATFTITGGSITVPAQHTLFTSARTVIKLPATMSSSWSSVYESDFDYLLTFAPIYTAAPGIVKSYITEKDTVAGWGQMRVKDLAGMPSAWFPVLQVQSRVITVDSFMLNGTPAPALVLSSLGVTQGQADTAYAENYYRTGEVTAFANVSFTDGTYSTPAQATTHTQRLGTTGITNVLNNAAVNIYPNPVSNGIISIDLPAMTGEWTYQLMDINGKTVTAGPLQASSNHAQLSLPTTAPGIYCIRLLNNDQQVCVKTIEIKN